MLTSCLKQYALSEKLLLFSKMIPIQMCEPPEGVEEIVERVCRRLGSDLVGVDFVFLDGRPLLNEIEDAVGCRMLYSLTDLDPARLLMERVHSKMSR